MKVDNNQTKKINLADTIPIGLNLIKQGKVKTVILGGAIYIIDTVASNLETLSDSTTKSPQPQVNSQIYVDTATDYLTQFGDRALKTLRIYESQAVAAIMYTPTKSEKPTNCSYQLQLLNNLLANLQAELNKLVDC